ncbi:MAG: fibronectin type III domain-containing protein, partial [Flavobacteriaceae bacterium]
MKKLLTTILISSISYAFAQDWTQQPEKLHYFTTKGKIEVVPDYNAMALYFPKTVDQTAATKLEAQLSSYNASISAITEVMDIKGVMLLRNANVFGDFSSKTSRDNFLAQYNSNGIQAYDMAPAFRVHGMKAWLTKRVMIKLKPGVELSAIQNMTSEYNTKFVRNIVGPDTYLLEVQDISRQFEFIQELQSQGLIEWGEPDFKMDLVKLEDPLYSDQWHLNNTGGSIDGFPLVEDNDIDAPEAWTISTGNSSVVVAVIDDGVEEHRDMNTLLPGFTPVNNGDGTPDSNGDHGQACAGLIGALHNDIDARGVAPQSSFFSINIFASNTSNADVATGVRWAAEQGGAHITSNSWGYSTCTDRAVEAVAEAFDWAAVNGRGGLGTVSLVASGNDYGTCVGFPANLASVMAVGAVDGAGEISVYSNQGPTLDITAPSNTNNGSVFYHGIRTLDREGSAGYSNGATTGGFGGTSAATPIAAGVAALILAVDPSLTKTQVEEVMYNSAKDLGDPGFDNTFGHGVVNAYDALLSLNQEPDVTPPTIPTSFAASDIEDTKLVLTWTASTDDRAVAGYRVFQDGSELQTTTSTSLTVQGLSASTTYNFEIEAYDGAGNLSDRATTQATTTEPKPCEEATNDDFESGFGNWIDGGSDARRSASDSQYANSGTYAVRLRDDTSTSNIRTGNLDFSGISRVQIDFTYITVSFDNPSEDFFLEYSTNGGSSWSQIEEWNLNDEFVNNQRYFEQVVFDATFSSTTQFRFRCDASNNGDRLYLDDIVITSCSSTEPTDEEAPSTPTDVAASNITDTSADITWTDASDNVGVTGYDVYVDGELDGSTTSTSYSLTGLSPETSYSVAVRAKDAAGNESGEGSTSFTTGAFVDSQAPTQPTNLSSSNETTTSADITWEPSTDNVGVTGYNVYVGGTLNGTTASTSYSLTGLDPATTYSVAVEATDAAENTSTQASIEVTTLSPPDEEAPSTPTDVAASNITDTSADITWTDASDNVGVTGYDVYVDGELDGSTTSTSYSLTGLSPETSYSVAVRAKDAAGNESGEGSTSFTTGAFVDSQAPTQPTNLSSSNETTTSADITWEPSTDNVGVTGYNVYVGGTLNGTTASTSYSLTGLDPATTYSVAVEATDAAENTSTQASIEVTTLSPPDEEAPSTPTDVAASNIT